MAKIKTIKNNGTTIYPITSALAVKDTAGIPLELAVNKAVLVGGADR